jgi:hypothetical protein
LEVYSADMNKIIVCWLVLSLNTVSGIAQSRIEQKSQDDSVVSKKNYSPNYFLAGGILTPKTYWVRASLLLTYAKTESMSWTQDTDWRIFPIFSLYLYDIRRVPGLESFSGDLGGGIGAGITLLKKMTNSFWFHSESEIEVLLGGWITGLGISWVSNNEHFISRIGPFQYFNFTNNRVATLKKLIDLSDIDREATAKVPKPGAMVKCLI